MKKKDLLVLLACLLLVGAGLAVAFWPRTVPYSRCSQLYRHYADVEGVNPTFIKSFRLGGGHRADVTLLQATDSAGWARLRADFHVQDLWPVLRPAMGDDDDLVLTQSAFAVREFHADLSLADNTVVAVSYGRQSVSVFHTASTEEKNAAMWHNVMEHVRDEVPVALGLAHTAWRFDQVDSLELPEWDTTISINDVFVFMFINDKAGVYLSNGNENDATFSTPFTYTMDENGEGRIVYHYPDAWPFYMKLQEDNRFSYDPVLQTLTIHYDENEYGGAMSYIFQRITGK